MKRFLALDMGEKRIGVAVSDALGMLAHPLTTLQWRGINRLVADLEVLIQQNEIAGLVIGVPLTLKGTHSKKTLEIMEIIAKLRARLAVEIFEADERLTTKMASDALKAVGKKPSKQRHNIDQIAAVYILQSYLDRIQS